jgi:hypothetical protein
VDASALRAPAPLNGALDCAIEMGACPESCEVPIGTMLDQCRSANAYVDCYRIELNASARISDYIEAFYSSPVFKIERGILAMVAGKSASDQDAKALATDETRQFSIWKVESRNLSEILLSTGRTRSWLMVGPSVEPGATGHTLLFGSAVFPGPNQSSGMGLPFHALLGFHKLYSKALLASAASKLATMHGHNGTEPT